MKLFTTFLTLLLTQVLFSQNQPYLYVERGEDEESSISYPPNTEFHLFNEAGDLILSDGDLDEPFEITSTHMLLLQPPYREDTDRLVLNSGRISMKTPYETYIDEKPELPQQNKYGRYTGPIKGTKEYFKSKNEGERNVLIIFNNDLVFRYFDGEARAWYDGDEVEITGNYIIDLPTSVAKISYNPKNGDSWWVFENKQ